MVDPVTTAVGGLLGAMIAVLWSDPYRNRKGQYTSYARGYQSWSFQAIMGGFVGASLTSLVLPFLVLNPLASVVGLTIVSYLVYVKLVDPR